MKDLKKVGEVTLDYKGSKVCAFQWEWLEENDKGKEMVKKDVVCHLFRFGSKNKVLNLGEMSDGSKFTAVAQAVNEAKYLVDYYLENKLERTLFLLGFKREDMFKYNSMKIFDRVKEKEFLLKSMVFVDVETKNEERVVSSHHGNRESSLVVTQTKRNKNGINSTQCFAMGDFRKRFTKK